MVTCNATGSATRLYVFLEALGSANDEYIR